MIDRLKNRPHFNPSALVAALLLATPAMSQNAVPTAVTPAPIAAPPSLEPYTKGRSAFQLPSGEFDPIVKDFADQLIAQIAPNGENGSPCETFDWHLTKMAGAFDCLPDALKFELTHILVHMARHPEEHDEAQFMRNIYPFMVTLSGSFEAANDDVVYAQKAFDFLAEQNGEPVTEEQMTEVFDGQNGIAQAFTILSLYSIAVNAGNGAAFASQWKAALDDLTILNPNN